MHRIMNIFLRFVLSESLCKRGCFFFLFASCVLVCSFQPPPLPQPSAERPPTRRKRVASLRCKIEREADTHADTSAGCIWRTDFSLVPVHGLTCRNQQVCAREQMAFLPVRAAARPFACVRHHSAQTERARALPV